MLEERGVMNSGEDADSNKEAEDIVVTAITLEDHEQEDLRKWEEEKRRQQQHESTPKGGNTCDIPALFGFGSQLSSSSSSSSHAISSSTLRSPTRNNRSLSPSWFQPYMFDDMYQMTMQEVDEVGIEPSAMFTGPLIPVQKGIVVEKKPEEKYKELEIDHLYLVVHGIGETFFSKSSNSMTGIKAFKESINSIRRLSLQQRMAIDKELGVPTEKRSEFLSLEWHNCIHNKVFVDIWKLVRSFSLQIDAFCLIIFLCTSNP